MSRKLLILRPEPGASATAARAAEVGLEAVVAPIFTLRPLAWEAPDPADHDAILLTSANAPRLAGKQLARFLALPCYAVGETTAEAARAAGFGTIRTGAGDAADAAALMRAEGRQRPLHLCGREHVATGLDSRQVYAADALDALPAKARAALSENAVVLLHSPRSAGHFAALVGAERGAIDVAAISPAAAAAAGEGWRRKAAAAAPRDEALLELAAQLCQTVPDGG